MNLEALQNISEDKLDKLMKIAAILGDGQIIGLRSVSLEQLIKEYISYVQLNRAPKTIEGVKLVCKHLLKYFSPSRDINTIQLRDCECFLDTLKKSAPKGVYNYLRTLRAMFNKAIEWNYLRDNPFARVKLPKRQTTKPSYVTEDILCELEKYLQPEIVKDVVKIAFYTGCRLGELVNLTWQDVNLKDDLLMIGNKSFQTKGRKQRIVPIHPKVREIILKKIKSKKIKVKSEVMEAEETTLIQLPDKKRYVFAKSNGYKFTGDYFSRRFKKACRAAGIDDDIHFHCLRHGAATKMILNGAPLPTVQKILGHANIQTTMVYTHPDLESLREAVGLL